MACMMGCDAIPFDNGNERMIGNTGKYLNQPVQGLGDCRGPLGGNGDLSMVKRLNGLVACTTRCQKHNRWREVFVTKNLKEVSWMDGRRHE